MGVILLLQGDEYNAEAQLKALTSNSNALFYLGTIQIHKAKMANTEETANQFYEKARGFFKDASDRGNSLAKYKYAKLLLFTANPPVQSIVLPHMLCAAAAQQPKALRFIANLYLIGDFLPQDFTLACQCLECAAKQGHPEAKADLESFYKTHCDSC